MNNLKEITVVVPTLVKNISPSWIDQINNYVKNGINVYLSVPQNQRKNDVYQLGFDKKVHILQSNLIGQVNQRQFAYKFCTTNFILNMDDDIYFPLKNLVKLFDQYLKMPDNSCLAPTIKLKNEKLLKYKFINIFREFFLYSELNPKPGTISKSTFPVPYLNFSKFDEVQEVDWLAGGVLLLRRKHLIKEKYFKFKGKAYCEDLIHSYLLKNKNLKLYICNFCFFETSVKSYRDLGPINFFKYIKADFKIRNYFRNLINNSFTPFFTAYLYLLISYSLSKILKLILNSNEIA